MPSSLAARVIVHKLVSRPRHDVMKTPEIIRQMDEADNASTARSLRHNSDAIYEKLRRLLRLTADAA
jgi:hypothetical protein